jgi:drug/metabolite transporter (DMT)-like permease
LDTTVFLAVLAAAAMHAGWNAFVKGSGDAFAALTHMAVGGLLLSLPLVIVLSLPAPPSHGWLAASVAVHTGYRFLLIAAYRIGDLSQVYPIARGAAPLLTALLTALILGETLSPMGYAGIALLGAGIAVLSARGGRIGGFEPVAVSLALLTACSIALYSMVDGVGARLAGSSVSYIAWLFLLDSVIMIAVGLVVRGPALFATLTSIWPRVLAATAIAQLSYTLAVWAMTRAPIAQVSALRETSVLFAALIGVVFLKERLTRWRLIAAPIIVAGMVLLRMG